MDIVGNAGHVEAVRRCWGNWLQEALEKFSIPPEFVGQINGQGEIIPERIETIARMSRNCRRCSLSAEIRQVLEHPGLVIVCSPRSAKAGSE